MMWVTLYMIKTRHLSLLSYLDIKFTWHVLYFIAFPLICWAGLVFFSFLSMCDAFFLCFTGIVFIVLNERLLFFCFLNQ